MSMSILGNAVSRREDPTLLRGESRFVADLPADGGLFAHFVRSSVSHANLKSVQVAEASRAADVVGVFTAAELDLPGLSAGQQRSAEPNPNPYLDRPCLARDRVRFVGEAVAVVVAANQAAAVDAAELVAIDLEVLPAVVDPMIAADGGGPLLFPEHGSNVVIDYPGTDPGALEGADVVVTARFLNQRVAPVPLETGGILAAPTADGGLEVWVSTQTPFAVRAAICAGLDLAPDAVRVRAPAVGGGFGAKGGAYPEHVVIAALARRLGRPVRWVETRSENLVAMTHGRGQVQEVELGAQADGTLVGLRARAVTDVGAYPWRGGTAIMTSRLMASGVYRIPCVDIHSQGVVTNKTPAGPYRGAGRPEAAALLERAMELLAAKLEIDPIALRRKNLLRPDEFPYETPTGASYDSGDYAAALDEALRLAGYDELRAEQARRRAAADPLALGVGIACFCEVSGNGPEYGSVRVAPDGSVQVTTGSAPHGQGHETTFAQVAAEILGIPMDRIEVVHSDTGIVPRGVGTFGSRSGQLAGSAIHRSADEVVARAREVAAELLETAPEDVVRDDRGGFAVAGVPVRSLAWEEVVAGAYEREVLLAAEADFSQTGGTFPFGAHVAAVEVDTETGAVHLRQLVAVDDCGRMLNPMIVAGQIHGGLAQGVAQALFEAVIYDTDANPLTVTLADYLWPSAADLPAWQLGEMVTPSPRNPLGAKGVGESGTVGSTPAVQNAVIDALAPFGVRHLDLPLSPERVWEAIASNRPGL